MKLIYLKSALKCDSFDVAIDIKIQFFRVLVTIEPDRSLLQFVTTNCYCTTLYESFRLIMNKGLCGVIPPFLMQKTFFEIYFKAPFN